MQELEIYISNTTPQLPYNIGAVWVIPNTYKWQHETWSDALMSDAVLLQIEKQARAIVPDVSTATGRKAIASVAAKVARSKTALDEMGKNLTADLRQKVNAVD